MTRLLVSVRSAAEAIEALTGGCDLLDAKEPAAGALGAVAPEVLAQILAVAGSCPVSAALGELGELGDAFPPLPPGLTFAKVGLAGWAGRDWADRLALLPCPNLVVAAYADHERAGSPCPEAILEVVVQQHRAGFLLDTWAKDGAGLRAWVSDVRLRRLLAQARRLEIPVALAGSLTPTDLLALADLAPDWWAVRGAACEGGRQGHVSRLHVAHLASVVRGRSTPACLPVRTT